MDCVKANKGLELLKLCLQIAILFVALVAMIEGRTERVKAANEKLTILTLLAQANPDNETIQAAYVAETNDKEVKAPVEKSGGSQNSETQGSEEGSHEAEEGDVIPGLDLYL